VQTSGKTVCQVISWSQWWRWSQSPKRQFVSNTWHNFQSKKILLNCFHMLFPVKAYLTCMWYAAPIPQYSVYYFHIAIGHGEVKDNNCILEDSHMISYLPWHWWPIYISVANGRNNSIPVHWMELLYLGYTSGPMCSALNSKFYLV
jgi:hypothetical protein